ncbi:hypothetical protein EBZ39_03780 [bacterium]|nr:hypothetical protein [bacterium]
MLPIIQSLLGNGLSLVANAVMAKGQAFVEDKLGVKLTPNMPPMEHEEELMRLKIEENKLDLKELGMRLEDVGSARNRETQIATSKDAPLLNKIVTPLLALGILFLTFTLFAFVMFDDSPVDSSRKDILIYILGVLSAISTQIVSYYFGSSQGSKDKSDQLKEALK